MTTKPRKAAKAKPAESLLVELRTEELPPKSLERLSSAFAESLTEALRENNFLEPESSAEAFATPRRLAVRISRVLAKQPDRVLERKGPSVQAGLDARGQPTQALLGFARACKAEVAKLERRKDEKGGEYFVFKMKQKGEPLTQHLAAIVTAALKKLPVAKVMRWGSGEAQFVRPVHGVILLHGSKVVPGAVLDVKAGNTTRGHRFLSRGDIVIRRAADYEKLLRTRGKVIASFTERRDAIVKQLRAAAKRQRAQVFFPRDWTVAEGASDSDPVQRHVIARSILEANEELLDEVTAIVEWPTVYAGEFEQEFLAVPPQCISLTMQKNQKYFALFNDRAELQPDYLLVSNLETKSAANIVGGNARVLRARLSDARFFFEQDQKSKLADRVPRLANVVFHNKLGTQLERVQRMEKLAVEIGRSLGLDANQLRDVERAAHLCKADLLTEMVGEFPELQGIMGYYYARHDGEPAEVASAIARHYMPRFANDALPALAVEKCVALADKLDTLVGMFGIDLAPTGEKDPFGLRRAGLGVLRILIEQQLPLDLKELIERARAFYTRVAMAPNVRQQLQDFFYDRLRFYLREKGYAADEVDAVLALKPARLDQVPARLDAIKKFRALPEGMALAAANKRIHNILRQAGKTAPDAAESQGAAAPASDGSMLREPAEKDLATQLDRIVERTGPLVAKGDYETALKELAGLRGAVDSFFDHVMVMVEDENLRRARLQLLARIREEFHLIADVSRLQG
ncbi:MAG: glycine--tRNA ligase subunit beta [Sulfurifustaceae bacterium]